MAEYNDCRDELKSIHSNDEPITVGQLIDILNNPRIDKNARICSINTEDSSCYFINNISFVGQEIDHVLTCTQELFDDDDRTEPEDKYLQLQDEIQRIKDDFRGMNSTDIVFT